MTETTYLIWSNHHSAWWGPGGCGYRLNPDDGGRYTRADAERWLGRGCDCCRLPELLVPAEWVIGAGDRVIQSAISAAARAAVEAGTVNTHYRRVTHADDIVRELTAELDKADAERARLQDELETTTAAYERRTRQLAAERDQARGLSADLRQARDARDQAIATSQRLRVGLVAARERAAAYPAHVIEAGGPDHYAAGQAQALHAAILAADWDAVRQIAADPWTAGDDVDTARGALAGAGELGGVGREGAGR